MPSSVVTALQALLSRSVAVGPGQTQEVSRVNRLAIVSCIVGRAVGSFNDLTDEEAIGCIESITTSMQLQLTAYKARGEVRRIIQPNYQDGLRVSPGMIVLSTGKGWTFCVMDHTTGDEDMAAIRADRDSRRRQGQPPLELVVMGHLRSLAPATDLQEAQVVMGVTDVAVPLSNTAISAPPQVSSVGF
jgi:hypothetical protein